MIVLGAEERQGRRCRSSVLVGVDEVVGRRDGDAGDEVCLTKKEGGADDLAQSQMTYR